ncbi:MAG: Gfo/Idh/MocA family oxidoreductase [Fimbriimonadaceae bacterium]|nr:Gfo/Idh/MocA family oxidoreductase [Fimbriimonadaceae bacterium]
MERPARIGILGGGGILGAHLPAYRQLGAACEVVVVAEPEPARHAAIRQLAGCDVPIVADYHEVLARPDVDGVDIILPHHLHLPATLAAAAAGKHVITEKVMARNIAECDQMIAACDAAGVTLTVCHDRRYHGEWQALKGIVETGWLGDIFFWKLDHNQDVVIPPSSWAHWRDGIGGGCIMSCLTHQIDALRWYGGEVARVTCLTAVRPERMQGEFAGVVVGQMASGALAELSINWWTRSHQGANRLWYEMVQVCGSSGEAYRVDGRGTFVRIHDRDNQAARERFGEAVCDGFVAVPAGDWGGHQRCLAEWVKLLRGEPAAILTSGRECRGTVEVAEAAYRSVETGQTVALPLDPQPWNPSGMPANLRGLTAARQPDYHIDHGATRDR